MAATMSPTSSSSTNQETPAVNERVEERKDGSVQVAIRIRPLLPKEIAANAAVCVQAQENAVCLTTANKCFTFDNVFPLYATQTDLYATALQPQMDSFLQGFNVTVIAYGQTGSGKTFTMGNHTSAKIGPRHSIVSQEDPALSLRTDVVDEDEGLIPRFLHELFARLADDPQTTQISVSFLEIYGEEIHDLLDSESKEAPENLVLRESKSGVWVQGLTEVKVSTRMEALEQMRLGCVRRITATTEMNEHSSRSHAVYTVKVVRRVSRQVAPRSKPSTPSTTGRRNSAPTVNVQARNKLAEPSSMKQLDPDDADNEEGTVTAKLTFVDLAGSERLKKTQAAGNRMKEGIQINVGLLALGNVINALSDERRKAGPHTHVPYRSSKLTRLLQDALGGNSRTLFIACISPAEINASETLNTLQYANRAKNIQNKAVKNIDSRSAELISLKAMNEILRRELVKSRFLDLRGKTTPAQLEMTIENLLLEPKVLAYLRQLEQLAASGGMGSFSDMLAAYERSDLFNVTGSRSGGIDGSNCSTDSGSEEFSFCEENAQATGNRRTYEGKADVAFSVENLSRMLHIISLTLEIPDIGKRWAQTSKTLEAKLASLDSQIHRKEVMIKTLQVAVNKMATWLASDVEPAPQEVSRRRKWEEQQRQLQVGQARERVLQEELSELSATKKVVFTQLQAHADSCRRELKTKHEMIRDARQSAPSGIPDSNPLDLLFRSAEIKQRFGISEFSSLARFLDNEERDMASQLDAEAQIARAPSNLFPGGISSPAQEKSASHIAEEMLHELQNALDEEDLGASLQQELRCRGEVLRKIVNGWASFSAEQGVTLTEQEFISQNERQLQQCEENIRHLTAAIKMQQDRKNNMSNLLNSLTCMNTAKSLVKCAFEELYRQKRLHLATFDDERATEADKREDQDHNPGESQQIVRQYESQLESMKEQHEKDIVATLAMMSQFNFSHAEERSPSLRSAQSSPAQQKQEFDAKLSEKDTEIKELRAKIDLLESRVQESQMKEEAFQMMDRCQQIWRDLGLNEETQASKFKDINALLMQKCSEELETLEAARDKLRESIDRTYSSVKCFERILCVTDPVDLKDLHVVAGRTLLEQERYLHSVHKLLEDMVVQRLSTRTRGLESVHELMTSMGIENVDDFRYAPKDDLKHINLSHVPRELAQLKRCQARLEESPLEWNAVFNNAVGVELSVEASKADELLLSALWNEKTKRLTQAESMAKDIRARLQQMEFTREELISTMERATAEFFGSEDRSDRLIDLCAWIHQKGGQMDVSNQGLETLGLVRDYLVEVHDGRTNALSFLYSTLEEANKISQDAAAITGMDAAVCGISARNHNQEFMESTVLDYGCTRRALESGQARLRDLPTAMERNIRALLFSLNDGFVAFGIETDAQRISFFLGSDDTSFNSKRATLARYILSSSADLKQHNDGPPATNGESVTHSFLSESDPLFKDFGRVYSAQFGRAQLMRLKQSISDVEIVKSTIQCAQRRLESLQKIMRLFTEINEFKKKIGDFEANASQKNRLFGSSLRLLEEERFRKMAAKRYPSLLAALRKEVEKWMKNEEGEFDLSILGQELKNLLIDMMNTDTELMHLDLAVLDSTRPSVRKYKTTVASSSSSNISSSGPATVVMTSVTNSRPKTEANGTTSKDMGHRRNSGVNLKVGKEQ
ncbi:TPA: hypothetical protein N0F65_009167 [Lagenidium giganteum]|uniref:Kinesin motor domain-containing protein n=1 Tax=Lagenidium giganteum TaxID=4803 RepID=A0AAV2YRT0_9STRA|nr:TPA: hypothetical protein N0F65_009167 [Lagenidium giganteum]